MKRTLLLLAISSLGGSALAVGPVSTLYIMNYGEFGANTGLDLVQGTGETSFATTNTIDIALGVYGDVRTMGYGNGDSGSRFSLAGAPLSGGPYTNTIPNSQLHDGTSDGTFNYAVDYTTGNVLRFSNTWTTPTTLFNVSGNLPGAGWITMNTADGSFWLSQWGGPDVVQHYSSGGSLLGSWNSGITTCAGLAFDRADGTLWMSQWDAMGSHNLFQFSQGGSLLQSASYTVQGQWYGMEFSTAPVPEPASLGALGIGAVALIRRRRRAA